MEILKFFKNYFNVFIDWNLTKLSYNFNAELMEIDCNDCITVSVGTGFQVSRFEFVSVFASISISRGEESISECV